MIKVNLLPQEYRKAEATPAKQFLSTIGAVVLALAMLVFWGYKYTELESRKGALAQKKEQIENQKSSLQLSKDLQDALKDFKARFDKIDEVANNRIVLSRKLDELWEILDKPRLPNRYEVWLTAMSFTVNPGGGGARGKKAVGGQVQIGGTSAGKMHRLADFHDDMSGSEFFKDFGEISPPWGSREELEGDREPKEGWTFRFNMSLKPLKDLYNDRDKAAGKVVPEAPKKGAEKPGTPPGGAK
jgi:Tfp pilus assembly protein PilN